MTCSRCQSHHPNPSCYVCWEEPREETRDFDDAAEWDGLETP
jgi:hypothetical protein